MTLVKEVKDIPPKLSSHPSIVYVNYQRVLQPLAIFNLIACPIRRCLLSTTKVMLQRLPVSSTIQAIAVIRPQCPQVRLTTRRSAPTYLRGENS